MKSNWYDMDAAALVLAGRRKSADSFALSHGVSHKALLPVGGVPMLLRVIRALRERGRIAPILIAIEELDALRGVPEIAGLLAADEVRVFAAQHSPSATVRAVLTQFNGPWPLLVTTADHALLTPEMIDCFLARAPKDADVVAGVVSAQAISAAYPGARRTILRFRDKALKGTNLFLVRSRAAEGLVAFWQAGEQHRKRPWRLVARIGPLAVTRFLLGALDLDEALALLRKKTGTVAAVVELPYAEAALDVDDADDLALAETILRTAP